MFQSQKGYHQVGKVKIIIFTKMDLYNLNKIHMNYFCITTWGRYLSLVAIFFGHSLYFNAQPILGEELLNQYNDTIDLLWFDEELSKSISKAPYYSLLEKKMLKKQIDLKRLPKSKKVLAANYGETGIPEHRDLFFQRYPFLRDDSVALAELEVAGAYGQLEWPINKDALEVYESFITQNAPSYAAFQVLQKLLADDIQSKNWEPALELVKQYKIHFGDDERFNQLFRILALPIDNQVIPAYLGGVNSRHEEYCPVIAPDGETLYFCRNEREKEQVYFAEKELDGWTDGETLGLQRRGNQVPLALSTDGNSLLLFERGKIKMTKKIKDGWSTPVPFSSAVNSASWQGSATLSSDGKVIIFAARRDDVIGVASSQNVDLYISFLQKDSSWSVPENIGFELNTSFSERTPFLHPDMETLYFSSSGHGGLGGMDVFVSRRLDDSWLNWSIPQNLGKDINTSEDDWGYVISTEGDLAYFSTSHPVHKDLDLFQVSVPENYRPQQISSIRGKLLSRKGEPIEADILVEDLNTQALFSSLRSDPKDGSYFLLLPKGKLYGYTVSKPGYFPTSGNIDLQDENTHANLELDIELTTVEEMAVEELSLPVDNLFFAYNESVIKPSSFPALNRLADVLLANDYHIIIEGHTDNVGGEVYNKTLSKSRADAVKSYLIRKGCDQSKISIEAYGKSRPIAENSSEEGRQKNRRVAIRLKK